MPPGLFGAPSDGTSVALNPSNVQRPRGQELKLRRLWLFCVLLVTACENPAESELEQQLWEDLGIKDYQYEYLVSCFCGFNGPNPALITVRDGVVSKVEPVDGGSPFGGSVSAWPTIDSLFAIISRADAGNPNVLKVQYDETYHYPKKIDLDPVERAIDDEITYRVDRFIPLSASQ